MDNVITGLFQTLPAQIPPPDPDAMVCVVDDDVTVRVGLERLFRSARFPVETFASAGDYLGRKAKPGPVCLVIDVQLPGLDGLELQNMLVDHNEQMVFLTGHGDVPMCVKAMKAGAVDFLTKPVDDEILLAAVTRALDRSREVGVTRAKQSAARAVLDTLTPRELQVMQCVVAGMLNKQIAAKLGIAEKTVKIHRGRVMRKTLSISVPDLIWLALTANGAKNPQVRSPSRETSGLSPFDRESLPPDAARRIALPFNPAFPTS